VAIQFKPAVLENISLIIGLAGGTGSGKTLSGMKVSHGLSGGKKFCVIDTETGRAKHYAPRRGIAADNINTFDFDHADLSAPFRPDAYREAIFAADAAGYPVVMVDSMSHEWAGDGGVIDWHDEELDRMAGKEDWKKREACNMAAWIRPKTSHKQMVQRLLQLRCHLVLCFRAEEKIDMERDDKGKLKIVPKKSLTGLDGWIPICEKNLPFELTMSFLLTAAQPGYPKPIKLEAQHREFFPLDQPITNASGAKLAAWAAGGEVWNANTLAAEYEHLKDKAGLDVVEAKRLSSWAYLANADKKRLKDISDAAKKRFPESDTGAAQ
jgi:hypothetical protein